MLLALPSATTTTRRKFPFGNIAANQEKKDLFLTNHIAGYYILSELYIPMAEEQGKISETIETQLKDIVYSFKFGKYGQKSNRRAYIILGKYMLSVFSKDKYKKPDVLCPLVLLKSTDLVGKTMDCKFGESGELTFTFKVENDALSFLKDVQEKYNIISFLIKPIIRCVFRVNGNPLEIDKKDPPNPLLKFYEAYCRVYSEIGNVGISNYMKLLPRGRKILDLTGVEEIKMKAENMVNLNPVIGMLGMTSQFEGLAISGYPGEHLFERIGALMVNSYYLTKLTLSNCNVMNDDLEKFAVALEENKESKILYLNFSNNRFKDQGFYTISRFANILPLQTLILRNCGATHKGVCLLLEALYKNGTFPRTFREIDLSKNSFNNNPQSTMVFKYFFSKAESLRKCTLSEMDIVMYKFVDCLFENRYKLTELKKLDLSGNTIDAMEMSDIVKVLKTITDLNNLHFNDTKLTSSGIKFMMKEIITDNESRVVDLHIDSNKLGMSPKKLLETFKFGCSRNISKLTLSNNKITNQTILELSQVFKASPFLTELDMSGNIKKPTEQEAREIGEALARIPNLKKLSLAGTDEAQIEENSSCLLEALLQAPSLLELDLSYNKLGKVEVGRFSSFIKGLTRLQIFNFDMNSSDVSSFKALSESIQQNRSLMPHSFPKIDYQMILKKLGSGKKFDEAVSVARQLKEAFSRNQKLHLQKDAIDKIEKKKDKEKKRAGERERQKEQLEKKVEDEKKAEEDFEEARKEKVKSVKETQEKLKLDKMRSTALLKKKADLIEGESKDNIDMEGEPGDDDVYTSRTAEQLLKEDEQAKMQQEMRKKAEEEQAKLNANKYVINVGEEDTRDPQEEMLFTPAEINEILAAKQLGNPSADSVAFYQSCALPPEPNETLDFNEFFGEDPSEESAGDVYEGDMRSPVPGVDDLDIEIDENYEKEDAERYQRGEEYEGSEDDVGDVEENIPLPKLRIYEEDASSLDGTPLSDFVENIRSTPKKKDSRKKKSGSREDSLARLMRLAGSEED